MTNVDAKQEARAQVNAILETLAATEVDYDLLAELKEADRQQGSISSGTRRRQDLIPTFLTELHHRDPAAYAQIVVDGGIPAYVQDEGDASEWWDSDDAISLLDELQEALELAAPDHLYFGTHDGDGSDFGYWMPADTYERYVTLELDSMGFETAADARQYLLELPLDVQTRSPWGTDPYKKEYRVLLCTGGPHVELRGFMDLGAAMDARVYYRTHDGEAELPLDRDTEQRLRTFATSVAWSV